MNMYLPAGAMALAACTTATMAGPVVDLAPGATHDGLTGITNIMMPELIGSIVFDNMIDMSIASANADEGTLYQASLMTRLARSNQTGNLTFNFRIIDANDALAGQISHIEITGFAGLQTRVEYRAEEGYGDTGPTLASRSNDGDILTYGFGDEGLQSSDSSKYFFAMLDVADYDFDTYQPRATIYLTSGESISLDVTPPVPTPGALALLGMGGLCAARRRR